MAKRDFWSTMSARMSDAIAASAYIDAERCRHAARQRFSADRMVSEYLDLYRRIAADTQRVPGCEAGRSEAALA
jgi:glycogen synthase